MTNVFTAITLLLEMWDRFDKASAEYRRLIERAKSEGRDITNEELRQLRRQSQDLLDDWLAGHDNNS